MCYPCGSKYQPKQMYPLTAMVVDWLGAALKGAP